MTELNLDQFYFDDSFIKEELKNIDFSALTKGKQLRSKLISLSSKLFDLTKDDMVTLGRVVEMVHNATLTHDDVIDNSHTRRGSASVPALINNKKSVLLGDYMLAKALHEVSEFNNPKLTQELTLTLKELVEGEWIQYENTNPYQITSSLYETLALKKTGSLFRWAFTAPYIRAGIQNEKINTILSTFGEELGIIFQMTDDLIDFNEESKKSYGLDFRNNNINFVLLFVGKNHPELEKKFLQEDDIHNLSSEDAKIIKTATKHARSIILQKIEDAKKSLNLLSTEKEICNISPITEFASILDLIATRVY